MANTILIKSLHNAAGAPAHGSNLKIAELAVNTANDLTGNRGHIFMGVTEEGGTENAAGSSSPSAYNADQTAGIVWVGAPILNENNLGSNDATKLATQASIKSYVDTAAAAGDTSLANTKIWIGDSSGDKAEFALSGDVTMTAGGAVSIGATKVTGAMLNDDGISGQSELDAAPASSDELLLSDNGTLKRLSIENLAASSEFASGVPTTITVADESSDTTCFPLFATAVSGDLGPKSGTNLTFNSSTGALGATSFAGNLSGSDIASGTVAAARVATLNQNTSGTAAGLSATLTVASGGTGATSFADKSVIISQDSSTDTLAAVAMTTSGNILVGGSSGPAVTTLTGGSNITVSNGDGSISVAGTANDDVSVANLKTALAAGFAGNAVQIGDSGDTVTMGQNLVVTGDLTVSGATTTVNTATLTVEDPLISLASGNNAADAVDIGIYGLMDVTGSQDVYAGLFRDASDKVWKLFDLNQAAPGTTVDVSGTGYDHADLQLGAITADDASTFTTGLTTAALTATANLDIGAYTMTGTRFISDIATGTAPFGCASTTKVANLNADLLDGQTGSYYTDFSNMTVDANEISGDKVEGGTIAAITVTALTTAGISASADIDIGAHDLRAATVTADGLTAGRVVFAGTAGVLSSDSDMTFATDTLTVAKLGAWEATGAINFDDENMTNVDIDSGAIDGCNVTVGSGKTLNVSGGTLTTSAAQKAAIVAGVGANVDIGAYTLTAAGLTIDGTFTDGTMTIAGGILTDAVLNCGSYTAA